MGRPANLDPVKFCDSCKALMTRKRYNGRLEDLSVFQRRRYCGFRCMGDARVTDSPTLGTLRSRAQREVVRKPQCERCKGTCHLQRHHVNRDKADNRPENVETLCASCHAKEHWRTEKRKSSSTISKTSDWLDVGTERP